MNPLVRLSGPAAPFLVDNVNTDMIAPMYRPAQAGVLRGMAVKRQDLAGMLFAGLRYDTQVRASGFRAEPSVVSQRMFSPRRCQLRLRIIARYRRVDALRLRHSLRDRTELWRDLS